MNIFTAALLEAPGDLPGRANHSKEEEKVQNFHVRAWHIEVYLLNESGEEVPASVFEKVTYKLHPSFEKRAIQSTFVTSATVSDELDLHSFIWWKEIYAS